MTLTAGFETLELTVSDGVAEVRLNRPDRANCLNEALWSELREAFRAVDADPATRVVVLSGAGKHFCAGIDLDMLGTLREVGGPAASRGHAGEALRRIITDLQDVMSWAERCRVPVLAAVHGACIGAGLDLVTACDLRYATAAARFVLKEVDLGVVADLGVLQRLPRIVGEGVARELAYTGRTITGTEAERLRLVNAVYDTEDELRAAVLTMARDLVGKSPLALRGIKHAITYARDHSTADGLEQVATWNAATLVSSDLDEAIAATQDKRTPRFAD